MWRLNGIQEVKGSIPFNSTNFHVATLKRAWPQRLTSWSSAHPKFDLEHPMTETALNSAFSKTSESPLHGGLSTADLERLSQDYLLDCDYRMQSPRTIETRRIFLRNLLWFLKHRNYETCGTAELRQFFSYLQHGHAEPGGRWGKEGLVKQVRPITVKDYYVNLCSLFNWLVEDGALDVSPLTKILKPKVLAEQVQPFTQGQIEALLKAARSSSNPKRDEAIVLFLYDTGVRASELCGLKMRDLDLGSRHASVPGKGNKRRLRGCLYKYWFLNCKL